MGRTAIGIGLGLVALALVARAENDWTRWRGPHGDGVLRESRLHADSLKRGPRILWKVTLGTSFSSPVIQGEYVYAMGNIKRMVPNKGTLAEDFVYCLNVETGDVVWQYKYCSLPRPQASPTVDGALLYTLSRYGELHCFHSQTGGLSWHKSMTKDLGVLPTKDGYAASPVVEGRLLILNGNERGIALDKETGEIVWRSPDACAGSHSTPVMFDMAGKRCAAVFGYKALHVVEVGTGEPLCSYDYPYHKGSISAVDPIVSQCRILLSSTHASARLIDVSGFEPQLVWERKELKTHFSSWVLVDGYLYGITGTARDRRLRSVLRCVEFQTGRAMWAREGLGYGSLIAVGKKLIVLTERGGLHVVQATPSSCEEVFKYPGLFPTSKKDSYLCWAPPVFCRGLLFLRDYADTLVCVDARE